VAVSSVKHYIEIDWPDGTCKEYKVVVNLLPGSRGDRINPPEHPGMEVISIVDMQGKDCTAEVEASEEFEKWRDRLLDVTVGEVADRAADAEEREYDFRKEEGSLH
jgi:hypothetical protein